MKQLTEEEGVLLEQLVDKHAMSTVLSALALIASEKSEHVRTNWQDKSLAKGWASVSTRIQTTADVVETYGF